ncbi:MAG: hypothetical protein J6Y60_08800, partial [Treponema sp.]|nr:hypothetical protein [Treponema sp.]
GSSFCPEIYFKKNMQLLDVSKRDFKKFPLETQKVVAEGSSFSLNSTNTPRDGAYSPHFCG